MVPSESSSDFVPQKVAKALMPKPCSKSRVVVFIARPRSKSPGY